MPRFTHDEPDDDEESPDGVYDDDGPPTVECGNCGEEIYEDADRCPHCGTYQSDEDSGQGPRRSTWISIMLILALLAALMMVVG